MLRELGFEDIKVCKLDRSGDEGVLAGVGSCPPPCMPSSLSVDRLALFSLPKRFAFSDKRIRGGMKLTEN